MLGVTLGVSATLAVPLALDEPVPLRVPLPDGVGATEPVRLRLGPCEGVRLPELLRVVIWLGVETWLGDGLHAVLRAVSASPGHAAPAQDTPRSALSKAPRGEPKPGAGGAPAPPDSCHTTPSVSA